MTADTIFLFNRDSNRNAGHAAVNGFCTAACAEKKGMQPKLLASVGQPPWLNKSVCQSMHNENVSIYTVFLLLLPA